MSRTLFGTCFGLLAIVLAVTALIAVAPSDSGADSAYSQSYGDVTTYTVTIECTKYGTVDIQSITDVPAGSVFTVSGNVFTINGVSVTATPDEQDVEHTYEFRSWSPYISGQPLTEDITVTANFACSPREYTITYMNGSEVYHTQKQEYGSSVNLPADPERAATDTISYEFDRWVDYANNKTVKGDITFTAAYIAVLKEVVISSEGVITLEPDNENIKLPVGLLDDIKNNDDAKRLIIKLTNGTLDINVDTIRKTASGDAVVSIKSIDKSNLSQDLQEKIGARPVYSIVFGDIHTFSGNISIQVKYNLLDGENASCVKIWYLKDNQSYEQIGGSYSDGLVTFSTNHLSNYAVAYDTSAAQANYNWDWIAALVGILIVIGLAVYLFKRKKH